ncbi:hypothetical protein ISS30_06095 [bacterium]|nr:hypothetical protein [bacterium]
MNLSELNIIDRLNELLKSAKICDIIDNIAARLEQKLSDNPQDKLAWEPVPLSIFGNKLPIPIKSSWVFILRANSDSGAERHPNSVQRMMSYHNTGDIQLWDGARWISNILVSEEDSPLDDRWISIPANTWHKAVVANENWVVVSFHTVPAEDLIEARPVESDLGKNKARKYL